MLKQVLRLLAGLFSSHSPLSNVVNIGFKNVRGLIPEWISSDFTLTYSFQKESITFQLFSVKQNCKTLGYFILNGSVVSLVYKSNHIPEKDEIGEIPLLSAGNNANSISIYSSQDNQPSFSSFSYICKPSSLVVSDSSSQSFAVYLENVPEYYNEAVKNGCSPTTGAMLISFYDRYSQYTDLYKGLLPLKHDDNPVSVNAFIKIMASYMKTDEEGTYSNLAVSGLNRYFNDHGCQGFKISTNNTFDDYLNYFRCSNNPVFVNIAGHSILGIGYAQLRTYYPNGSQGISNYMITHYDWRSIQGSYYVLGNELKEFYYIYK